MRAKDIIFSMKIISPAPENASGKKGLGVVVGDIDLDGWPDIFVTNDGVRNFLYRNKGDGTFQRPATAPAA